MPNATVLVVDDEPLIRWSLVNRLKEEGYRTVEAGTAGDAVIAEGARYFAGSAWNLAWHPAEQK